MLIPIANLVIPAVLLLVCCRMLPVAPWVARKCVHIGIGSMLMTADPESDYFAICIFASAVAAIAVVGLPIGKAGGSILGAYARRNDVGILGYSATICLAVSLNLPLREIAPLFYADPAGAIVGRTLANSKSVANPKLFGTQKTLLGSVAVALVATISTFLGQEQHILARILLGISVAAIELFGGQLDNPLIGVFLILTAILR